MLEPRARPGSRCASDRWLWPGLAARSWDGRLRGIGLSALALHGLSMPEASCSRPSNWSVLALCGRRGLVDLSAVAVDGSPMDANASRDSNQRLHRLEAVIFLCEDKIDTLLGDPLEHAGTVEADDFEGTESDTVRIKVEAAERRSVWPRRARLTRRSLGSTKRGRENRPASRPPRGERPPAGLDGTQNVLVRQRARLVKARTWLERARNPRPVPSPESRARLSDPDSRLMLSKRGGYVQGRSLQLA